METSATPQQAWEAWADPEKIAHWFVDRARSEAKMGETMTWFFDEFGYVMPYKVIGSEPGELFALKWEAPQGGPTGILEVTIERKGELTVVRLINSGFREDSAWNDEYEGVVSGWKMALAILKHYLENNFGRAKTALLVMRPASFSYEQLHPYFADASKLALWLTKSGAIGKVGETCQLKFWDGGNLTGEVLADTGREVTVAWKEIDGTLELKGFSMGPQQVAGVRCITWRSTEEQTQRLKKQLSEALERLSALLPVTDAKNIAMPSSKAPFQEKI